jgi:hypothetical protein
VTDNPVSEPTDAGSTADRSGPVWLVLSLVGVVVVVVALATQFIGGDDDPSASSAEPSSTTDDTASGAPDASDGSGATDTPGAADSVSTSAGTTVESATAREQITPPPAWGSIDLPDTPPGQVVEQFLAAVLAADCARADRTLTAGFREREGNCRTSGLVPDDVEEYAADVDEPEPAKDEQVVVVPATLTFAGQDFRYQFELVIAGAAWKIDGVEQ